MHGKWPYDHSSVLTEWPSEVCMYVCMLGECCLFRVKWVYARLRAPVHDELVTLNKWLLHHHYAL